MSDIEEYFTDGSDNEDNESSDDDDKKQNTKKTNEISIENILNNSDDDSDENSDEDDDEDDDKIKEQNDYYDEDDEQIGGGNSDDDEDENDVDDYGSENENVVAKSSNKSKKPQKITIDPVLGDDDEDDDDEDDENYLQKFDNEISKNYISEQHPECAHHNYDEIAKLSIVIKNNDGIIIDPLHKTLPFLTKYEKTRILGQRAKQIECGATPFIKVPEGIIDAHIIAELELQQKRIPFIIRRPLPGGGSEYWNLKDLEVLLF